MSTNIKKILFVFLLTAIIGLSCQQREVADLIIINADLATVDETQRGDAVAVIGDRIHAIGNTSDIEKLQGENTEVIDAENQFVMPGFIEGHGHFSGLGQSLMNLNFLKSKSWDEIVAMVEERIKTAEPGEWITGRGWHQEKWTQALENSVLGYPFHDRLSAISPENPVMLGHASGHGLFANAKAMEIAGVTKETPNPFGGEIVRDAQGEAIGVFEERAQAIIRDAYSDYLATISDEEKLENWKQGIQLAEDECLRKGVTSFQDAGTSVAHIKRYEDLANAGELEVRLWLMMRDGKDNLRAAAPEFPKLNLGNHFLTIRAIKAAVDGALGAFGAWLLKPYNDKADFIGQNTTKVEDLKDIADIAIANDLQYCIHAIGDRANRIVLDLYEASFEEHPEKSDLRWRIEHAQHLDTADIPRFKELEIIASMQGIHCTSDAPFVEKRLGTFRARFGSYPWRSLLDRGVVIANGTDAPVEDVDPILSYYASVTRKRADTGFEFFPEQAMTREEALYSYTLGNAYAGFEEDLKGSITPGKLADFVILDHNLLTCSDDEILNTKVVRTIVGGETAFTAD